MKQRENTCTDVRSPPSSSWKKEYSAWSVLNMAGNKQAWPGNFVSKMPSNNFIGINLLQCHGDWLIQWFIKWLVDIDFSCCLNCVSLRTNWASCEFYPGLTVTFLIYRHYLIAEKELIGHTVQEIRLVCSVLPGK